MYRTKNYIKNEKYFNQKPKNLNKIKNRKQ